MKAEPERIMKLRLVVARVGEMDLARWWNTSGQLGSVGTSVVQRGFRRTHYFAQARSVFAVAAHRCRELYYRPGSVTLWSLPADVEDEIELRWEEWIDDAPSAVGVRYSRHVRSRQGSNRPIDRRASTAGARVVGVRFEGRRAAWGARRVEA